MTVSEDQEEKMYEMFSILKHFNVVTKYLERQKLTVTLVRYIFVEEIKIYRCTKLSLCVVARIVHNSELKYGNVKILEGKESELTEEEKVQTECVNEGSVS